MKHPRGVHGEARDGKALPWNAVEAWDGLAPPVVTGAQREALFAAIAAISVGGAGCGVPEVTRGIVSTRDVFAVCRGCPGPVLARCDTRCGREFGIGTRYAEATEALLAAVEARAGVVVARDSLRGALMRKLRTREAWDGLTVLTVGVAAVDRRTPIAQLVGANGLLSEFYMNGKALRWRTTYRRSGVARLNVRQSHLLDMAIPAPSLGKLSDLCVVPRPWWCEHGNWVSDTFSGCTE
jgi:hypothetical protein